MFYFFLKCLEKMLNVNIFVILEISNNFILKFIFNKNKNVNF
jgi:hypothetical protein